tara:strand:+ start:168 stop:770 length:603 start_codon:yes stop_codon:yes gene_type:complete
MAYIEGQFPQDVSLEDNFFTCDNEKIFYNDIKSIAVYVKESVTNLTYYTGIPTFKDLSSNLRILLLNGDRVEIRVTAYSEWGPFKNKIGANLTDDALSFANFIEQKTFNQRKKNYLDTGNSEIYFKYQGYEFLKNKKIRLGKKIYASLDTNEFKVTKYFKKLLFEKKGNFFGDIFNLDDDEIAINLYHDEDVVIDLLNKI